MGRPKTEVPFRDRGEIERSARDFVESIPADGHLLDAFELARRSGVRVELFGFGDPKVSGAITRGGSAAVIRVSDREPYRRQNFTVAHELGHHVLHPVRDWTDTPSTMYRRESWRGDSAARRAEYQANLFAAALLMPEAAVRERWELLWSPDFLAPAFRVSRPAMVRRLEELGLIVPSVEGFSYADVSSLSGDPSPTGPAPLADEMGEIPRFRPVAVDEQGRIIPMSAAEREARQYALRRVLKAAGPVGPDDLSDPS